MNEVVHNLLLARDKFMPGMHSEQPRFTYSACGPFIKKQRKNTKIKKTQEIQDIFIKTN